MITYLVAFFSIVIFRIQQAFSFIIKDVLHKNLTFTGRTYIWDKGLKFIKDRLIIGYGKEASSIRTQKFHNKFAVNCHNNILEELYQGGILLLIAYVYMLFVAFKRLFNYRKEKIAQLIGWFLFVLFIMSLMEVYTSCIIFVFYVMCYNIKYITEKINPKKVGVYENRK